jgi:hypothetical protein
MRIAVHEVTPTIVVPDKYLVDTEAALIEAIFPDPNKFDPSAAILSPRVTKTAAINDTILARMAGAPIELLAEDSLESSEEAGDHNAFLYPAELLATLQPSGYPPASKSALPLWSSRTWTNPGRLGQRDPLYLD